MGCEFTDACREKRIDPDDVYLEIRSAHVVVLPKKRTTRKVGAEAANVFAVRIWNRCFGIAYGLPSIVDLAAKGVVPTVWSSESAEVERESVGVYRHPPFFKRPRRVQETVLGLRPPAIIDAHGTAEISIVQNAKSVTWYLTCATASLKQPRAIVVTHGIQRFRNRLSVFISPLFLPVKAAVPR
jgi:hypothetical protein